MIERDECDPRTVVGDALPASAGRSELATLFAMHYEHVRREHTAQRAPGLLTFAFDLGSAAIASTHWSKTRPDAINALTVGRHRACDVCLPKDPAISLRHACVISHPFRAGSGRVSFRILDLRTHLAFSDCLGQRLEGVIADGPVLVVIGRYALLLLPTGADTQLPERASASWNVIAEPVYLNAQSRRSSVATTVVSAGVRDSGPAAALPRTSASVIEGPARASSALLGGREEPLGTLAVSANGDLRKLVVSARAASQGVLLGCYERCDDDRLSHLRHHAISRVHLLIWLYEEALYAIDTASTNGTFVLRDDKRVRARLVRLSAGVAVVLADDRARVTWNPL